VVEVPISLTGGDGAVAGLLFDLDAQASWYSDVHCYIDESLDSAYALAVHPLGTSGGRLKLRFLLMSDSQPPVLIPDGVFAVCDFDIADTQSYGTDPLDATNVEMADREGSALPTAVANGYINFYRTGCSIGEPTGTSADLLLVVIPVLLLIVARDRKLLPAMAALAALLGVGCVAYGSDASGTWEAAGVGQTRAAIIARAPSTRLGMPSVGTLGHHIWVLNNLAVTRRRISATIQVSGVSFAPTVFHGRIRTNQVIGKLLNAKGRTVAVIRAQATPTGITGTFRAKMERGHFAWTTSDPVAFRLAIVAAAEGK